MGLDGIHWKVLRLCADQLQCVHHDLHPLSDPSHHSTLPQITQPFPKRTTASNLGNFSLIILSPVAAKCYILLLYKANRSTADPQVATMLCSI